MIIGDPAKFAVESGVTQIVQRRSQIALGFFVLYIQGRRYGVREADATMLAASFDAVARRIARRGHHTSPIVMSAEAGDVAHAYRQAFYGTSNDDEFYLEMSRREMQEAFVGRGISWAPDGDSAFDDGSYVLQVEEEQEVRLIAFTGLGDALLYEPASVCDLRLPADEFYSILREWFTAFELEVRSVLS